MMQGNPLCVVQVSPVFWCTTRGIAAAQTRTKVRAMVRAMRGGGLEHKKEDVLFRAGSGGLLFVVPATTADLLVADEHKELEAADLMVLRDAQAVSKTPTEVQGWVHICFQLHYFAPVV